jgi:hypothetical protein
VSDNLFAQINAKVREIQAQSGGNANVSVNVSRTVGADGTVTARAQVSSTEKMVNGTPVSDLRADQRPNAPSPTANGSNIRFTPPLALAPSVQAEAFGLSAKEQQVVRELQASDVSVRRHEAQHFRAAGGVASGTANFSLVQGPDGKFYAVQGSVDISTTSTNDPQKAAQQAISFQNAATAPGDASAQDFAAANKFFRSAGLSSFQKAAELAPSSTSTPTETKQSTNAPRLPVDVKV